MQPLVLLVTGANRGLGLGIVESLTKSQRPLIVYAASRNGESKVESSQNVEVKSCKLDITDKESIDSLLASIKSLDVVVNNAGAQSIGQKQTLEVYKNVLDVNYRGTLQMCQAAIPKLNKGGRIVNVSSVASKLQLYSKPIQERFRNPDMTLDQLETLVQEYETSIKNKTEKKDGWPIEKPYCISKAAVNALTAILARENKSLLINCCCPGWVNSDMGSLVGKPSKSPAEGAIIPVRLALEDIDGVSGRYWENSDVSSTENGHVTAW